MAQIYFFSSVQCDVLNFGSDTSRTITPCGLSYLIKDKFGQKYLTDLLRHQTSFLPICLEIWFQRAEPVSQQRFKLLYSVPSLNLPADLLEEAQFHSQ